MSYKTYTSEFKVKVVIEVLQGDKSLREIASEYNLNPNMLRNWKSEFLENASTVFENPKKVEKAARRKEESLKKESIYSVVAAHSVRHVRAAHDCMRQQAIITPDSRLTASLSAAQNGGKVAHTVRRYGATEQLRKKKKPC